MPESRVSETDLVVPALGLAAKRPTGEIATADLIAELGEIFHPSGQDAQILHSRHDTYFSQKVRNLISHRGSPSNFIANGYAEYSGEGIRITDKGRKLLREIGS
jgi:hypothetical protein